MAQLPGAAFIRGRDRIVRICDASSKRLVPETFTKNSSTAEYESPNGSTMLGLKGLVTADYSPVNNNQEFFLLGDEGFRDSVGTSRAGDLACTAYFTLALTTGTSGGSVTTTKDVDAALALILAAEHDLNKEVYVEVLTHLGRDTTNNSDLYHTRAFNAGVVDLSESTPADGLLELSWTFQSRGEVFGGVLKPSTALDIYA